MRSPERRSQRMQEPVIGTSRRLTVGAPESRDCVPRLQHYRVNMRAGLEPSVGQHPLLANSRALARPASTGTGDEASPGAPHILASDRMRAPERRSAARLLRTAMKEG